MQLLLQEISYPEMCRHRGLFNVLLQSGVGWCLCVGASSRLPSPRGYASGQHLHEEISDLKIELARRDADVEYLEGQLAEAVAANRPHMRPHADRPPEQVSLQLTYHSPVVHRPCHAQICASLPDAWLCVLVCIA